MVDQTQENEQQEYMNTEKVPIWKSFGYAASPALLYTALSSACYSLFMEAGLANSQIVLQAASVLVCLVFFAWRAKREGIAVKGVKKSVFRYPAVFCYVMAVVMCGLVNNYLFMILMSKTGKISSDYWRVTEAFYNQELMMEILALCVIGPLAEELVYRGFVYQRLRSQTSEITAEVLSALLFGVLHFNIVQGVYAFVLGLLLAHIVYKTGSLLAAAAAHMAANLVSVLWTETDWLGFLNWNGVGRYAAALLCVVLMVIFLSYGNRLMKNRTRKK